MQSGAAAVQSGAAAVQSRAAAAQSRAAAAQPRATGVPAAITFGCGHPGAAAATDASCSSGSGCCSSGAHAGVPAPAGASSSGAEEQIRGALADGMRPDPSSRPIPPSGAQFGCCEVEDCTKNAVYPRKNLPAGHEGHPGKPGRCGKHEGGARCEVDGCTKGAVDPRQHLPAGHEGHPGKPGRCGEHEGGAWCEVDGCSKKAVHPRSGLPEGHAGHPGKPGRCGEHEGGACCEVEGCSRRAAHPRRGLLPDAAPALHGVPGFCGHHGGGGRCLRAEGCCGHVAYRYGLCRGHSVCDCIDGATQPCAMFLTPPPLAPHAYSLLLTSRHFFAPHLSPPSRCASCWPAKYNRVFDRNDCFFIAQVNLADEDTLFSALAGEIDARVAASHPGGANIQTRVEGIQLRTGVRPGLTSLASWLHLIVYALPPTRTVHYYLLTGMYDCEAHRSVNLSQAEIDQTSTVSQVLALFFSSQHGLGAALAPGVDGNGHAVRLHAQDGRRGRSGHLLHRDRYRSHRREVTYVLAFASHEQAVWQLVRGESRTHVLPASRHMHLLLFGASANCMAMHGVGDLQPTVWPPAEMYGVYQRYSLSGSAQYTQGVEHGGVQSLLRSQALFGGVVAISAHSPSPSHVEC